MNALALANHLWQSTLFAAGIGLMTLAFRRNAAAVRHALWLAASIKFLVPFAALMALGSHLGLRAPVRLVQHEVVVATTAALPLSPFDASPTTSAPVSLLGAAALPWLVVTLWVAGSLLVTRNVVGPVAAGRGDRPRRVDCRMRRRRGHAAPRRTAGRRPAAHRPGRVRCRDGAGCVRHPATGVAVVGDDWPASERRAGRNDLCPRTVARPAPRQPCRGDSHGGRSGVVVPPAGVVDWHAAGRRARTRLRRGGAGVRSSTRGLRGINPQGVPALCRIAAPMRCRRHRLRISESESSESCRTARPSA